jgi:phosphatidylserine decarboxylase
VKMRPSRAEVPPNLFSPATTSLDPASARTLIQSATAAVMSPLSGGHRTVPLNGGVNPEDDDDEGDEDVLDDDGLSSSSSDEDFEDAEEDGEMRHSPAGLDLVGSLYDHTIGLPGSKPSDMKQLDQVPAEGALLTPSQNQDQHREHNAKPSKTPGRQSSIPGYFDRPARPNLHATESGISGIATPGGGRSRLPIFKRNKSRTPSRVSKRDFNFDASQGREVLGIVILEIKGATDLPRMKNGEFPCIK